MHSINEIVNYGTTGVCKIVDIIYKKISGTDFEYYVLKPIYDEQATVFVPTKNEILTAKMRPILSAPEINELIKAMPDEQNVWIQNENLRHEKHKEIINSGDRKAQVKLIKSIYFHKREQLQNSKKLRMVDEIALKEAEKLLYNEFALVLDIKPEQVVAYITEELSLEHL